jgi:hypothetical protein
MTIANPEAAQVFADATIGTVFEVLFTQVVGP